MDYHWKTIIEIFDLQYFQTIITIPVRKKSVCENFCGIILMKGKNLKDCFLRVLFFLRKMFCRY